MNATVNVVCYKSKTLSNGEHPLMLSISKDRKKKYQSLCLSRGINFVDIAYVKAINIVDNRIIYNRRKTYKEINIQILPEAQVILERYAQSRENNYLFPILDIIKDTTEKQRNICIHNVLYKIGCLFR